jgi:hypothetical protein
MLTKNNSTGFKILRLCAIATLCLTAVSCSRSTSEATTGAASRTSDASDTASAPVTIKKIPAGQEFVGFLSTYANLKPNPKFENTKSFVTDDPNKNIHRYVAVMIDPPVIYVSTDTDEKNVPDKGVAALRDYFQNAITKAVQDAYPVVQSPGPLVLRLRSAIVGIDVGQPAQGDSKDSDALQRPLNIGKVGIEAEFVDSESGEQIAAAVDHQNLGDGAQVGAANFTRDEKFRAATEAFDGWAARLRDFLDSANELSNEDISHVESTNFPYAGNGAKKK